ncbi:MAG TPA: uroporphyrinogen-III C-methyltransferase [Nitrospirota bacterium]|nr:uroporphyrinogen-III C-methyltransferase [Nitrospirota bacterium]
MTSSIGKVYLIGAGPGDPGLITVKGLECVKKADVIIYDYLANERLLDQRRPEAELVYVGKQGGRHTLPQDEINRLIVKRAREGRIVARLKGGDPFIFGRGGEEAEELVDNGIPFEIVPGVTAATAVPTYAGIPLTHRDYTASVAFITGHEDPTKPESTVHWDRIATGIGTLVFFMGMKNLPNIVDNLVNHGRSPETPVALIQWGTRTDQKVVTGSLRDIVSKVQAAKLGPPAIIVVGDVVRLRDKLNWYESKPLFGKRVIVTRSRDQASVFAEMLIDRGATTIEFPTIDVVPPSSWDELDAAITAIEAYQWIIFTSANAIRFFMERLRTLNKDLRLLKGVNICVVGPKTAEALDCYGLKPDLVPSEFKAEGVLAALGGTKVRGLKILIPRAKVARELIPDKLREQGAEVTVATAYENVRPAADLERVLKLFNEKKINAVTFTSSSTVHNFIEILGPKEYKKLMEGVAVACIGPVTAKTAEEFGLKTDIMPKDYTIPALVDAMVEFYNRVH